MAADAAPDAKNGVPTVQNGCVGARLAASATEDDDKSKIPTPEKVAWVVLRADQTADEASLQAFFLERGPAYAHPRRVFFVDALPLTGTNKVDKQHLIQQTQQQMA